MTPGPGAPSDGALVLLGAAHVHLPDHLRRISQRGWTVGHVHDRDPDRRARLCRALSAQPLPDLDGLAGLAGLAAAGAVVCSETRHHEADTTAALDAGLAVFCEKPLGGSAGAATRIAERAMAAGRLLQTGYFLRTNPALRRVRDWIAQGRLGQVVSARLHFAHDGGFADWLDLDCWMTDPDLACYGGFADEAVHVIDLAQWLLGPIRSAHAVTGTILGWPVDDHGAAVISFDSGATGLLEAGWTDARMRLELDIVGEDAAIFLREGEVALTRRGQDSPAETCRLAPLDAGTGIIPFLCTLEGADAVGLVPPAEAARVNAILDAMGLRLGAG